MKKPLFAAGDPALARYAPTPGPTGIRAWLGAALYYIYAALATLVIGTWGLTQLRHGRDGVHRVANAWMTQMIGAARLFMGLVVEVRGTPPTGDCIVAAKHQSFWDILAIAYAVPRRSFIMKREVMRIPVMGWYAFKAGCIPIDRSRGRDAMSLISQDIQARLDDQDLGQLIIYPEGTRTPPGSHRPYKHGVGTIHSQTGLRVVPVAVNCGMFWPKRGIPLRGGRAVIEFLPDMPQGLDHERFMAELRQRIETASDALMAEAGLEITPDPEAAAPPSAPAPDHGKRDQ